MVKSFGLATFLFGKKKQPKSKRYGLLINEKYYFFRDITLMETFFKDPANKWSTITNLPEESHRKIE